MKELCVVYLARAHNDIEHFRRFLESYRQNPGGIEHDFLVVFKGFGTPHDIQEHLVLLAPFRYSTFEVSDEGFDITAYFKVARHYSEDYLYFCFLNSYSVIQDREWLRKLYDNISLPGVALVGATGSWNSNNANAREWFGRVVSAPIRYLRKRINSIQHKARQQSENLQHGKAPPPKKLGSLIQSFWINFSLIVYFGPFPNYHVRTNAFMISSELMNLISCPDLKTKMDAYRFESGRAGLTAQILNKGERILVVGKDGVGYEKEAWNKSKTFWQSEQENLLVADNQTRDYQEGSIERRQYLSSLAWRDNCSETNNE